MDTNLNPTPDLNPNQLLKAYEVADRLNISRALAYRLMSEGRIRTIRFAGSVRVRLVDLEDFIQTHLTN